MEYLCVVEYFFDESPGGSGRVAWDIAKVMRDRGHSVTILFYRKTGQEEGISRYDGVQLVRFEKVEKPSWHPGRLNAIIDSTASACRRWLSGRNFDVVHIHSPLMGVGIISALGNLPRYVVTVHSPVVLEQEIIWRNQGVAGLLKLVFGRRLLEKMENRLLTAAAAIHTLSDFSRNTIDGFYGVGKKVSVIPHWYEHRENRKTKQFAREQLGWPADARIFLTVRGLKPRNGIDIAIRALAPLVQDSGNNCRFFIGGSGPLREHLENLSIELGAAKNIRFLGRLSDAELELAYSAADMFILPTLALECFGLITIEALSFGCPVISSDAAAIPETMRPILPNCIVPAGDVHAIQKKAAEYLSGELSLPGEDVLTSHVFNRYTKDIVVSRYLQLFENP